MHPQQWGQQQHMGYPAAHQWSGHNDPYQLHPQQHAYAPYQQQQQHSIMGQHPGNYDPYQHTRAPPPPQQPQRAVVHLQGGQYPPPPRQYPPPNAQYPPPRGMQPQPFPAGTQGVPQQFSGDGAYSSHMRGQVGLRQPQGGIISQQHQHYPGHQDTQQQMMQQQPRPPPPRPPPPQHEPQQYQQDSGAAAQQYAGPHNPAVAPSSSAPQPPPQQSPASAQAIAASAPSAAPAVGAGGGDGGSISSTSQTVNSGSVLLAALQDNSHQGWAASSRDIHTLEAEWLAHGGSNSTNNAAAPATDDSSTSNSTAAPIVDSRAVGGPMGLTPPQSVVDSNPGAGSSGSSSMQPQKAPAGRVDPRGVYMVGIEPGITAQQLEAMFSGYGKVQNVTIIAVKYHTTKAAFVNFADASAAQKVLAQGSIKIGGRAVLVRPKVVKAKATASQGDASSSAQQQQQKQGAKQAGKQTGDAGAGPSNAVGTSSRVLGHNQDGLPMLRGAACCPYYMGTGECAYFDDCRYHHPMNAFHPECVAQGKKPVRYNTAQLPSYARLVNFTERLWDYESCAEAQLKIWLARHLIASENSGCGMFDDSAAVPAAYEYEEVPNEAQPLGPYSCTIAEADQVLQLLWKAQPDDASQQPMPYKGRVWHLLSDDPYYELEADPSGDCDPHQSWVQLRLANIKGLLNF